MSQPAETLRMKRGLALRKSKAVTLHPEHAGSNRMKRQAKSRRRRAGGGAGLAFRRSRPWTRFCP